MSFMDRISSIENRMSQLDGSVNKPAAAPGAFQKVAMNPTTGAPPTGCPDSGDSQLPVDHEHDGGCPALQAGAAAPASTVGDWSGGPKDFDGMVSDASKKYGVDEALIKAVIKQESGFNPTATSSCGARGMMQLMPDTGRELGVLQPHRSLPEHHGRNQVPQAVAGPLRRQHD